MEKIKLTQYSTGSGCGCKIAPDTLETILHSVKAPSYFPGLLIGNQSKDDAAVFDLGDGRGLISTTDFFTPIVDDPYDFGYIAAVNAISDIYAMGGKPLMAIAILGWPVEKLGADIANEVIRGGREACEAAGIPLAGGHSIDIPEPVFGLAVNGEVAIDNIQSNNSAKDGDVLFLTKPLGTGLAATAEKKGIAEEQDLLLSKNSMKRLNSIGADLSKIQGVHSMTDITGFGLAGHLMEMCDGSGLGCDIQLSSVPRFPFVQDYIKKGCMPNGTTRNWRSYGSKIQGISADSLMLLADPQTSGGLLISSSQEASEEVQKLLQENNWEHKPIGRMRSLNDGDPVIRINE